MENGRDMVITVFGFRSTFNEVSVRAPAPLGLGRPLTCGVRTAGPLANMGKKLQLIQKNALADHLPVHSVFMYFLAHPNETNTDRSPQASLLHGVKLDEVQ